MESIGKIAGAPASAMARSFPKPPPPHQPSGATQVRPTVEKEERPQEYVAPASGMEEAVNEMNRFVQRTTALQFRFDDISHQVVVSVVDAENSKVIRQIPSEEMLELAVRMRELQGILFNRQV